MKNFPVNVDGKEYWVSRSVAVSVTLFTILGDTVYVLANKRGKGLPNHVGEWNVVSGYLDYDETLNDACVREVFEETGLNIKNLNLTQRCIEDEPSRENQVILFRYSGLYIDTDCYMKGILPKVTNKYAEPDEVEEVKWIPLNNLEDYKWTSEKHKQLIRTYSLVEADYDTIELLKSGFLLP